MKKLLVQKSANITQNELVQHDFGLKPKIGQPYLLISSPAYLILNDKNA